MDIQGMIKKSKKAQKEFALNFNQEQVDKVVREIGKVVFENAEELAKMAVEETRMGVLEHKIAKNKNKARIIWNHLRDKKSMGVISRDEELGIVTIAKPIGVVGAITPCTNPIVTPMANIMQALKGKNSIIVSPHPRTKKCTAYLFDLYNKALSKYNVPENLLQYIAEPTIEATNELMRSADIIVATGGMNMVKAAYSSGKPSLGVGPGNIQCIIDRGVDITQAVPKIVTGRSFDNGIICSGEQAVMIPEEQYDEVIAEFKKNDVYYADKQDEIDRLEEVLFPGGKISKDVVGVCSADIAKKAGFDIPKNTKAILIPVAREDKINIFRKEKMFPVMIALKYTDFDQAIEIAQENLDIEGRGHSVVIHSNKPENIEKLGQAVTVSRVVVNAPCATTVGGSYSNGLAPTTTLGCGTWGNNSLSENVDYKHFLNTTKVAYLMDEREVPSDEELWYR